MVDLVQCFPKIARQRYTVNQVTEYSEMGVESDIFWTDQQSKDAAVAVASLNAKGATGGAEAWIYLGDYSSSARAWLNQKFKPKDNGPSDLSSIRPGTAILLSGNMNVREGMPQLSKVCGGRKRYQECEKYLGTLPLNLQVTVVDVPPSSNPQKWAKVRFEPAALYQIPQFQNP